MFDVMKQVAQVAVQSVEFDLKNTEVDPAAWMKAHGFDDVSFIKAPGMIVATVRGRDAFIAGSARTIVVEAGITATVGLPDISKSFDDPHLGVPTFDSLFSLEDLEIFEVTLTGNPAVGRLADFQIVKSLDPGGTGEKLEPKRVPFCKTHDERRQVFGYVLVPDLPDHQGDIINAENVEIAAHSFMKVMSGRRQQGDGIGLEHKVFEGFGHPIESFIDHEGKFGVKGGWVLGTQIIDSVVWGKIKSGEILGYSIGGRGTRRPLEGAQLKAATLERDAMLTTELHAVAFRKSAFSADEARERAEAMNLTGGEVRENDNYTLFIQKAADQFVGNFEECEVLAGVLTVRGELKEPAPDAEELGKSGLPVAPLLPVARPIVDDADTETDARIRQAAAPLRTVSRSDTRMPEAGGTKVLVVRQGRLFSVARGLSTRTALGKLFEGKTQKSGEDFDFDALIAEGGAVDADGRKTLADAFDMDVEVIDAALKAAEIGEDDVEIATTVVLASLADAGISALNAGNRISELEAALAKSLERIAAVEAAVVTFGKASPTRKSLGLEAGPPPPATEVDGASVDWGHSVIGMGNPALSDDEYNQAMFN